MFGYIVDSKERFGDWEIDTVLGKHGAGAMVTILERKTRFYVVKKCHLSQQMMSPKQP